MNPRQVASSSNAQALAGKEFGNVWPRCDVFGDPNQILVGILIDEGEMPEDNAVETVTRIWLEFPLLSYCAKVQNGLSMRWLPLT